MKRLVTVTMIFLVMLMFVSCTTRNVIYSNKTHKVSNLVAATNIKYEYFYRGFATMKQDAAINYPQGTFVIETNEDWHSFMDKYVPGIKYNVAVDFSKESLIYDGAFPPSSIYAQETKVSNLSIKDNKIEVGIYFVNNGIYAQNIDDIKHCFVNIVKINKSDIPNNIDNIYNK